MNFQSGSMQSWMEPVNIAGNLSEMQKVHGGLVDKVSASRGAQYIFADAKSHTDGDAKGDSKIDADFGAKVDAEGDAEVDAKVDEKYEDNYNSALNNDEEITTAVEERNPKLAAKQRNCHEF